MIHLDSSILLPLVLYSTMNNVIIDPGRDVVLDQSVKAAKVGLGVWDGLSGDGPDEMRPNIQLHGVLSHLSQPTSSKSVISVMSVMSRLVKYSVNC